MSLEHSGILAGSCPVTTLATAASRAQSTFALLRSGPRSAETEAGAGARVNMIKIVPRTNYSKYITEDTSDGCPPGVRFHGSLLNAWLPTPHTHGHMGAQVGGKAPFLMKPALSSAGNEAPDLGGNASLPWRGRTLAPRCLLCSCK